MPARPPAPPGRPGPDDDNDAELLARELAGVKPLASEPREPTAREKFDRELAERRRAAATVAPAADRFAVGGLSAVQPVAGDALVEFRRDGIQLRQWQKLRKGQIPWSLGVDLHGTTREEALRAVDRLIRQAQEEDSNCIRVVHGKGQGEPATSTIKAELNHWLRRHPQVLAFCSALPADGGAGALYVLLRRQRRE